MRLIYFKSLQPSIKAASRKARGNVLKFWRSINICIAPTSEVMHMPKYVSISPNCDTVKKFVTKRVSAGSIIVPSII